jgi:hypothetical protein
MKAAIKFTETGDFMLKKIIKALIKSKLHSKHHYSSSDLLKKKLYGHHPSKYGHKYYKKKHKSSFGFFKSFSSS